MFRKLLSLALAAWIAGAPLSCAGDAALEPRDGTERGSEDPEAALARIEDDLRESAEVRELLAMLRGAAERLAERGMAPRDLARLGSKNGFPPLETLGYSVEEAELLERRLEEIRDILLARYPELRALVPGGGTPAGTGGAPLRSGDEVEVPFDPPVKGSGVRCNWGPFVVALLTCANAAVAAGGNIGMYFICAYEALCSFCEGGWVTSACT